MYISPLFDLRFLPGSVSHVCLPGRQLGLVRGRGGRGVRGGAVGGGARVGGRHGVCPLSAGGDSLAVAALHPRLPRAEVGQPDSQRRLTVLVVLFPSSLVLLAIRVRSRAVRFWRHPVLILPQTATATLAGTELHHQAVALLLPHRSRLLLLRPVPRLPSTLLLAVQGHQLGLPMVEAGAVHEPALGAGRVVAHQLHCAGQVEDMFTLEKNWF